MTDDEIIRLLKSKHLCADGVRRSAPRHCRLAAARIAELNAEMAEQCRIIGAGGERELALLAKIDGLESIIRTDRQQFYPVKWWNRTCGIGDD